MKPSDEAIEAGARAGWEDAGTVEDLPSFDELPETEQAKMRKFVGVALNAALPVMLEQVPGWRIWETNRVHEIDDGCDTNPPCVYRLRSGPGAQQEETA